MKQKTVRRIFTTSLSLAIGAIAHAAPSVDWERSVDGPQSAPEQYQSMELSGTGDTYIQGYSYDGSTFSWFGSLLAKVNSRGELVWSVQKGGPTEQGESITKIFASGDAVYAIGTTAGSRFGANIFKSTVWKFRAADGTLLWRRVYEDAPSGESIPQDLSVDGNGNLLVVGSQRNDSGFYVGDDAFAQKFSPLGELVWSFVEARPILGLLWGQGFQFVRADSSGDVIVAGTYSQGALNEVLVRKLNQDSGTVDWEYSPEGDTRGTPNSLDLTSTGDPVLSMNLSTTIGGDHRPRIVFSRLSAQTGAPKWTTTETMLPLYEQLDFRDQVCLDSSDNVYATLRYDTDGNALAFQKHNDNIRTFKFSGQTGTRIWAVDRGTAVRNDYQSSKAIRAAKNGKVYVVGEENLPVGSGPAISSAMLLLELSQSTGQTLSATRVTSPGYALPFRVRIDAKSRLHIAGVHIGSGGNQNLWVSRWSTMSHLVAPGKTRISLD